MDDAVKAVLQEFEVRLEAETKQRGGLGGTLPSKFASEEEFHTWLDEFLLAVGPATGQLLNILVKEAKARTVVEIGTSYGYSTVWLAEAARAIGGKVITLEIHPKKHEFARGAVARAGLADFVDFRLGDAVEILKTMDQSMDFVLLDLWHELFIPCFDLFYPKLNPGALIAADNQLLPAYSREKMAAYRDHVRAKPDMQSVLLSVGAGIELSRCTRGAEII